MKIFTYGFETNWKFPYFVRGFIENFALMFTLGSKEFKFSLSTSLKLREIVEGVERENGDDIVGD